LIHSKRVLTKLEKFEIKYGFEGFAEGNNFLHRNFFGFKMGSELKFWELKVCFFDFRKLIKIDRNGPQILKFAWR
jgi:hypothetical protein